MAASPEHRISISDHNNNAGGSDGRVGPVSEPNEDEVWIQEVQCKIDSAFENSALPRYSKNETKPKICKLTVGEMSSQPGLETEGAFSKPSVVTIGPFHRQDPTSITDKEKWAIVELTNLLHKLDLGRSLLKMKDQVANARDSYCNLDVSESSDFKDDKSFAEMLLRDSYFILFLFTVELRKELAYYTLRPLTPKSAWLPLNLFQDDCFEFLNIIFNKDKIAPDLLIFDNQIPFFVIEELFTELESEKPLHEYALEFFETIHPRSARHCGDKINISPPEEFLHLLHLFHWSRVPQNKYALPQRQDSIDRAGYIPNATERKESATGIEKLEKPQQPDSIGWARHTPNATELRESATVFEKKTSSSSLDITFRRRRFNRIIGVLDIPEVHIRDYSSLIFHNLIAFEIQSSSRSRCTVAFSALMRNFLQREEDVKLLRQRGILVSSSMTDGQLVHLFARLSKLTENYQMPSDLCAICHQVQSCHNHPVSRFCGSVILQYFPNPLVTLSLFGATMIFILTLLQTIYAMRCHN